MTTPTYPSSALVTLDDVFAHLNISSTEDQTAVASEMQGFIAAATEFIEYQTGPIIPRVCTEVHNGGGVTIVLDNPPVLQVQSVTEWIGPTGYELLNAELGADTGAYAYSLDDPAAGIICRRYSGGIAGRFIPGFRNIAVVYQAGRQTVPADIRMATLEDIRGLFTQTQYSNRAGSFGAGSDAGDSWSPTSMNPVGTFPRLAALLSSKSRIPSIA